ncbi:hypothetical protein GCM10027203_17750 [Nonomuraea fastidiosa]
MGRRGNDGPYSYLAVKHGHPVVSGNPAKEARRARDRIGTNLTIAWDISLAGRPDERDSTASS